MLANPMSKRVRKFRDMVRFPASPPMFIELKDHLVLLWYELAIQFLEFVIGSLFGHQYQPGIDSSRSILLGVKDS